MTLLELAQSFALQNRNWGSRFHDLPKVTRLELRFHGSWPPRSCSFIYFLSTKSNFILCNNSVMHNTTSCWRLHLSQWTEHVCTEHICVKIVPGIVSPPYLRTENILGQTEFWQTQKPKFVSSWTGFPGSLKDTWEKWLTLDTSKKRDAKLFSLLFSCALNVCLNVLL